MNRLIFEQHKNNKNHYRVWNFKKECLGVIEFFRSWNKFVFFPHTNTHFDLDCLSEIVNKLKKLNKKGK